MNQMKLFSLSQEERNDRFAQLVGKLQALAWHRAEKKRIMAEAKDAIETLEAEIECMAEDLGEGEVDRAMAAITDSGAVVSIKRGKR